MYSVHSKIVDWYDILDGVGCVLEVFHIGCDMSKLNT